MFEQNGVRSKLADSGPLIGGVSAFEANFLYLISMLLVIVIGSMVQAWSPFFGLILTEIFLILLPALLYRSLRKQLSFAALRLNWPGIWVAMAAILTGLGLNLFNGWLTGVLLTLFGYSSAYGSAFVPKDYAQAYLAVIGLAIFAPLCEEILFRGVILRGYESHGFWRSIGIVAVMFAAYHLSLPRFIAVLPVALALNWVASRSRSISSSMLLHFAYNGVSAVLLGMSVVSQDYAPGWYGTLPVALVGLLLAAAALILIDRIMGSREKRLEIVKRFEDVSPTEATRPVTRQQAADAMTAAVESRASRKNYLFMWGRDWPLVVTLVLVLGMGLADFIIGRSPDLLISQRLTFQPAEVASPASWKYGLVNAGDQTIGEANCQRTVQTDRIRLECAIHQTAYQVTIGQSFFQDTAYDRTVTADWDPATLNLIHLDSRTRGALLNNTVSADYGNGRELTLHVTWSGQVQIPLTLPNDVLYLDEWPWRLMSIPFGDGYGGRTSLAYPFLFSSGLNRNAPAQVDLVAMVYSKEQVIVPAGKFEAWKVIVDKSTAWYDTAAPHTLVKYTDGMTTFLLEGSR